MKRRTCLGDGLHESWTVYVISLVFLLVFFQFRQKLPVVAERPRADVQCSDQVEPQAWES